MENAKSPAFEPVNKIPDIITFCEYIISDNKEIIILGDTKDSFIITVTDKLNPNIKGVFNCWQYGNKELEKDTTYFFNQYIIKGGIWKNTQIRIFGGNNDDETVRAKNPIIKAIIKNDIKHNFQRGDFKKLNKYITETDGALFCVYLFENKIFKVSKFLPEDNNRFFNNKSYRDCVKLNEQFDVNYDARSVRTAKEIAKFNKARANNKMSQLSYHMYNVEDKLPHVRSDERSEACLKDLIYYTNLASVDQAKIDAQKNGIGVTTIICD